MTTRSLERTRGELSRFLTARRRALSPADVGLPASGRRRTPGLRREEVAALAGVGLTWYTWFEQGRDIRVSESFLLNVARALRLDDAECCHLFLLAHRRPPPSEARQADSVSPLIQTLLDDLADRPAYVINQRWDAVAWNTAADRLLALDRRSAQERNIIRLVFTDPGLRRRMPNWREDAARMFEQLRCDLAAAPDAPSLLSLLEEVGALSPDFRRWRNDPPLSGYSHGIGAILAPDGEKLGFRHEVLTVDEFKHLRMIVFFNA